METFAADWLALREPADHAARPPQLARRLNGWIQARHEGSTTLSVLDLGSGAGSNLRYLAPRLFGAQAWTLVDHDAELLAGVLTPEGGVEVRRVVGDLAREGLDHVADAELVTASALLDLVSGDWVEALVQRCVSARSAALFALTYDGVFRWHDERPDATRPPPLEPRLDDAIRTAINVHQRQDKGLGLALGPDATSYLERSFEAHGYDTWRVPSPWRLTSADVALASALVAGWLDVAKASRDAASGERLDLWAQTRLTALREGRITLSVGHQDLLALPKSRSPQSR